MKNFVLALTLFVFSAGIMNAQESLPQLPVLKSLSRLNLNNQLLADNSNKEITAFQTPLTLNSLVKKNALNTPKSNSLKNLGDGNKYAPKKFNFSINPYAWFAAVGGTVGYIDGYKFGFNKSFSDAVKYLKMAVAVAGKFKYERVSFVYDISYINLKGFGTEVPLNTAHIYKANWTVKQTLYDLFLTYLFPSKSKGVMVDIYAGGRLFALETETTILDSNNIQSMRNYSNSWLDPVIGINSEFVLSKDLKWFGFAKGDIGGFGVNSQMTWQLARDT